MGAPPSPRAADRGREAFPPATWRRGEAKPASVACRSRHKRVHYVVGLRAPATAPADQSCTLLPCDATATRLTRFLLQAPGWRAASGAFSCGDRRGAWPTASGGHIADSRSPICAL